MAPGGWHSCSLYVISALRSSWVFSSPLLQPWHRSHTGSSTERQLPKRPVYSGSRLLRPFPTSPTLAWARSGGVPPVLGSPKVTLSFHPVNTAHSSLFPLKRFGDAPPPPPTPPTTYCGTATEAPSQASDCGIGGGGGGGGGVYVLRPSPGVTRRECRCQSAVTGGTSSSVWGKPRVAEFCDPGR